MLDGVLKVLKTLHSPPFHVCLKGFKVPILGDFNLRTPQNWGAGGQGGGSGNDSYLFKHPLRSSHKAAYDSIVALAKASTGRPGG